MHQHCHFCELLQHVLVVLKMQSTHAVAPVIRMIDLIRKLGSAVYLLSMEEQSEQGLLASYFVQLSAHCIYQ